MDDTRAAGQIFTRHFHQVPPVFVPPYNRISSALTRLLPDLGFAAVSAMPDRLSRKLLSLRARIGWLSFVNLPPLCATPRIDVHIDLIDWKTGTAVDTRVIARTLVEQLLARWRAGPDAGTPIGLLSHHLVHAAIWRLCDELLGLLRGHRAVKFIDLADWSHQNAAVGNAAV